MKKVFPVLLIFIFLTQNCIRTGILLDYYLNKKFIIDNFCENKDKPESHCEGSCHLKKQLKKQEEKEQKIPGFILEKSEITNQTELDLFSFVYNFKKIRYRENNLMDPGDAELEDVFHPPPAILA